MMAWIGSANLTQSAFSENRELVCEIPDEGSASAVFKGYWAEFSTPDQTWLDRYAVLCNQVSKTLKGESSLDPPKQAVSVAWAAYVALLKTKDAKRLDWLAEQLPEVTAIALSDWQRLSKEDARKLLGITKNYGGLGRLQGAGRAKNIFYESTRKNLQTRKQIADALNAIPTNPTASSFETMLKRAFELVVGENGVGEATFTRLLALRHPDHFVSVNGASIAGLAKLSGIAQRSLKRANGYVALIHWVTSEAWWRCAEPRDETSLYWKQRAALLDVLVYSRVPSNDAEAESEY